MGRAGPQYLIFETAGGFCGIAWNDVGITRFQLPTKSADDLRHVGAAAGAAEGGPLPHTGR
jgi:methylated-DNA-[protein]-cysteine S-methyltransferase